MGTSQKTVRTDALMQNLTPGPAYREGQKTSRDLGGHKPLERQQPKIPKKK